MGHHDEYQIVTVMIFAGGVGNKMENKRIYRSESQVNEQCQCEIC